MRTVFISDLHLSLGDQRDQSNAVVIKDFLQRVLDQVDINLVVVGDIKDLWQAYLFDTKRSAAAAVRDIESAHWDIFSLFSELRNQSRLIELRGNHDMLDPKLLQSRIVLDLGGTLFTIEHGNAYDNFNGKNWSTGKIATYFYSWLEYLPFRATSFIEDEYDFNRMSRVEQKMVAVARLRKTSASGRVASIFGHTHRQKLDMENAYYNCGSWVGNSSEYLIVGEDGRVVARRHVVGNAI